MKRLTGNSSVRWANICIWPIDELVNLRLNGRVKNNFIVKAGSYFELNDSDNELLELEFIMKPGNAKK